MGQMNQLELSLVTSKSPMTKLNQSSNMNCYGAIRWPLCLLYC